MGGDRLVRSGFARQLRIDAKPTGQAVSGGDIELKAKSFFNLDADVETVLIEDKAIIDASGFWQAESSGEIRERVVGCCEERLRLVSPQSMDAERAQYR